MYVVIEPNKQLSENAKEQYKKHQKSNYDQKKTESERETQFVCAYRCACMCMNEHEKWSENEMNK